MKKKLKASKPPAGVKVGVLAGKVKNLLPEALDLSALTASPDEDDDGPPEELTTTTAPAGEAEAEAEAEAFLAEKEKVKKGKQKKGETPQGKAVKYLWEDPENQELLEVLQEQTATKRKAKAARARVEKDGVTLLEGAHEEDDAQEAVQFLREELFFRRKRKRSVRDRFDRNVLSALSGARPMHVIKPSKGKKQKAEAT
eukprot:symbB.v1.2.023706.t1/scaffold2183.1/size166057/10